MSKKVFCKNCEYFDKWSSCYVPVINNKYNLKHREWYSPNEDDDIMKYSCESQNKNNDCKCYKVIIIRSLI